MTPYCPATSLPQLLHIFARLLMISAQKRAFPSKEALVDLADGLSMASCSFCIGGLHETQGIDGFELADVADHFGRLQPHPRRFGRNRSTDADDSHRRPC
jgi:hypothetical protein